MISSVYVLFFAITYHLCDLFRLEHGRDLYVRGIQEAWGQLLESLQLESRNVAQVVLCESIGEACAIAFAKEKNCPLAARLALVCPGDALLDNIPAQIRIWLCRCFSDCLAKRVVANALIVGESSEDLRDKYRHRVANQAKQATSSVALWVIVAQWYANTFARTLRLGA